MVLLVTAPKGIQVPTSKGRSETFDQGCLIPSSTASGLRSPPPLRHFALQQQKTKGLRLSVVMLRQLPDFSIPRSPAALKNNGLSLCQSLVLWTLQRTFPTGILLNSLGVGVGITFTWRMRKRKLLLYLAHSYTQRQSGSRSQGFWNAGSRSRLLHLPIRYKQTLPFFLSAKFRRCSRSMLGGPDHTQWKYKWTDDNKIVI